MKNLLITVIAINLIGCATYRTPDPPPMKSFEQFYKELNESSIDKNLNLSPGFVNYLQYRSQAHRIHHYVR